MHWTKATTARHVLLAEKKPRGLTEQQPSCLESSGVSRLQQSTSLAVTLLSQPLNPCHQDKKKGRQSQKIALFICSPCFAVIRWPMLFPSSSHLGFHRHLWRHWLRPQLVSIQGTGKYWRPQRTLHSPPAQRSPSAQLSWSISIHLTTLPLCSLDLKENLLSHLPPVTLSHPKTNILHSRWTSRANQLRCWPWAWPWFMPSSDKTEFGAPGSKQVSWSVRLNCLGRTSGRTKKHLLLKTG